MQKKFTPSSVVTGIILSCDLSCETRNQASKCSVPKAAVNQIVVVSLSIAQKTADLEL